MISTRGYAARSPQSPPAPFDFERRDLGPNDVLIDIAFCGICHSDIHQARDEWGGAMYPMVPGHEIVGVVSRVGANVKKLKVGDRAGVGTVVDSCRDCAACNAGEEVYCDRHKTVFTYNFKDHDGNLTQGGYSNKIVVDERFALSIPASLDLAAVSPLLCAGITTYSPLRHWGVQKGKKVGIVGLGGLGHLALKFSHAFGAHTVQFTTSKNKIEDAKKLGADEVILTKEAGWSKKHEDSFDFILDCVSAPHDVATYMSLLKRDGTLCTVGIPPQPIAIPPFAVASRRRNFSGSSTGGLKETQEMIDFCAKHDIVSDIEMTDYERLDKAWERVIAGDVKYRFVLDNKSL